MNKKTQNQIDDMNEKNHRNSDSNKNKNTIKHLSKPVTYRMSYVLGGLYLNESMIITDEYMQHKDWKQTRTVILKENRLQSNKKNSAERMYREIELRLKSLSEAQLKLFYSGTGEEKRQLLWLACCKSYRLIFELASELLEEKAARGEKELAVSDYEAFYTKKAAKSQKLHKLTQYTKQKGRNVTFKIMREADIINKDNEILPQLLSRKVKKVISQENPNMLNIYP